MNKDQEILTLLQKIYDSTSNIGILNHPLMLSITPAVIAFIGIIIGAILAYYFGIISHKKINEFDLRKKTFGELMGLKILTSQLYMSRFEALIYSDYHEQRWKLTGCIKESGDLAEAQRWMHKCEELGMTIAENNYKLFSVLGVIQTLYTSSTEFNKLTENIFNFKTPKIMVYASGMKTLEELEEWKIKGMSDLQKRVEECFANPINDLIAYVRDHINK